MILHYLAQIETLPVDSITQYGGLGIALIVVLGVMKWMAKRLEIKDAQIVELANEHRTEMQDVIKSNTEAFVSLKVAMTEIKIMVQDSGLDGLVRSLEKNLVALAVNQQHIARAAGINLESK